MKSSFLLSSLLLLSSQALAHHEPASLTVGWTGLLGLLAVVGALGLLNRQLRLASKSAQPTR